MVSLPLFFFFCDKMLFFVKKKRDQVDVILFQRDLWVPEARQGYIRPIFASALISDVSCRNAAYEQKKARFRRQTGARIGGISGRVQWHIIQHRYQEKDTSNDEPQQQSCSFGFQKQIKCFHDWIRYPIPFFVIMKFSRPISSSFRRSLRNIDRQRILIDVTVIFPECGHKLISRDRFAAVLH